MSFDRHVAMQTQNQSRDKTFSLSKDVTSYPFVVISSLTTLPQAITHLHSATID